MLWGFTQLGQIGHEGSNLSIRHANNVGDFVGGYRGKNGSSGDYGYGGKGAHDGADQCWSLHGHSQSWHVVANCQETSNIRSAIVANFLMDISPVWQLRVCLNHPSRWVR